ncbi:unnamed protein product [Sphagnum tenellum]
MEERGGEEEERHTQVSAEVQMATGQVQVLRKQSPASVPSFVLAVTYYALARRSRTRPRGSRQLVPADSLGVIFHTGNQGGVGGLFFSGTRNGGP